MLYKITGIAFYFSTIDQLLEYVLQRNDEFIATLSHRLIVKKRDGIVIALYHIKIDVENRNMILKRARRS